ncbi:MAG: hypothetical protein AB7O96_01035 [Pseudobdellovibrionaceae bacterium]
MAIDFIKDPKPEDITARNRSYDYYLEPEEEVMKELELDLELEQKKLNDEKEEFEKLKASELEKKKEAYKPFTKKK